MSGRERCLEEEQVDEEDDQPDPQTLQMSQTCWEFKSLQVSRRQHHHGDGDGDYDDDCDGDGDEKPPGQSGKRLHDHEGFPHQPEEKSEIIDDPDSVNRGRKRLKLQAIASMRSSQQAGSPIVTKSSASPRIMEGQTKTTTTSLQACRDYAANSDVDAACGKSPTRDLFVLVVQCSGLQCITSKAGYDVTLSTLLVADPTFSFFKVTLWRHMGERAARMIRAGDLVRLNRMSLTSFRGTAQANSTSQTRFRVVWRDDTFTTPQDAHDNMFTLSQSPLGGSGRQRQARPMFSQSDDLSVPREVACDLAAWAKREFPSVTHIDSCTSAVMGRGRAQDSKRLAPIGSLAAVRKGVQTTVRAWVLDTSAVERLWTWESTGGQRRKDLISRATAVLTDGQGREMTLQLWSSLASEEVVRKLREGAVGTASMAATVGTTGSTAQHGKQSLLDYSASRRGAGREAVVFEFTQLRPEFSFVCETLVLNTTRGSEIRTLSPSSPEACTIANTAVSSTRAPATLPMMGGVALRTCGEDSKRSQQEENEYLMAANTSPARYFDSVSDLIMTDGFCGKACVKCVVVRKVETPRCAASQDTIGQTEFRCPIGSAIVYLGDSAGASNTGRRGGVEAVIRVFLDGEALREFLGGICEDFFADASDRKFVCDGKGETGRRSTCSCHGHGKSGDVGVRKAVTAVACSLLDGLEKGGEEGELFDVVLACVASADENGRVVRGGTLYRLIELHASSLLALI